MLSEELATVLACPVCKSKVRLVAERWWVCINDQCRRKYPMDGPFPCMLPEEGDKYIDVSIDDLSKIVPHTGE